MTARTSDPPKSLPDGLILLRWAIFDPPLVRALLDKLTLWQALWLFLKAYPWLIVLVVPLYAVTIAITVAFGLPLHFPGAYRPEIVAAFQNAVGGWAQVVVLVSSSVKDLTFDFAFRLSVDFAFVVGLVGGLTVGPAVRQPVGLARNLAVGLATGLAVGLATGLAVGLATGLAVGLGFYLGFFRVPFYPWHLLNALWRLDFVRNPYRHDAVIWLPLWGATGRLAALAQEQPEAARDFVDFLLARRPLQRGLAMRLSHAATAGTWSQHPLQPEYLNPPPLVAEEPRFAPSADWQRQLESLRSELTGCQVQSQISLKQAAFARFQAMLAEFRRQTLREPPRWHRYYLDALAVWQQEAEKEREQLDRAAEQYEPITPNVYRPGEALQPEKDQALFLGRDDLRDRLAREILTAPNLPLLLIQGQRRVGKTSLLNFLSPLLGAGFKVVFQDLQDARIASVPAWLEDLRSRVARALGLPEAAQPLPQDWLQAWACFEDALAAPVTQHDYKLILALDEYEVLHSFLQQDPANGVRLLAAMRSFSQRQNRVVLLFVGSALLSELDAPNWSEYFVQTQRFRVDYLRKEDAVRLIVEPVKLRYPPEVLERLFDLTQGHPALLQLLCKKLVDIANREQKADMTITDLDLAIAEAIERETFPMLVFWKQFCATPASRRTVEQILRGEPPTDAASRMRLAEHGFIVERDGAWGMRVPLFESWLRQYKDAYPLSSTH